MHVIAFKMLPKWFHKFYATQHTTCATIPKRLGIGAIGLQGKMKHQKEYI